MRPKAAAAAVFTFYRRTTHAVHCAHVKHVLLLVRVHAVTLVAKVLKHAENILNIARTLRTYVKIIMYELRTYRNSTFGRIEGTGKLDGLNTGCQNK